MRGFYCIITCSLFFLASCNYKVIKDLDAYNAEKNTSLGKPLTGDLKLGVVTVKDYVLKVCLSCHVNKNKPELGSSDLIRQTLQTISSEVNANAMPPASEGYSPLTDCQKAILDEWIKQGAPDASDTTVADLAACKELSEQKDKLVDLPLEQMPITYTTLLERILKPRCITCHNTNNNTEAAEKLFYPASEILNDQVAWKTPAISSRIIKKLRRNDEKRMPPLEDGPPLSESEIQFIIKWIDAGKPE